MQTDKKFPNLTFFLPSKLAYRDGFVINTIIMIFTLKPQTFFKKSLLDIAVELSSAVEKIQNYF